MISCKLLILLLAAQIAGAPVVTISDKAERQYVTEQALVSYLENNGCNPQGMKVEDVDQHKIETVLLSHPMLKRAECYVTVNGRVKINVEQRVPMYKVITADEVYYIDTDRKAMPAWQSVTTTVMTASGNIGKRMAREELAEFMQWISDSKYWRDAIRRVEVRSPKQVVLIEKSGRHVLLGELTDYEAKMAKLRKFREQQIPGEPEYREIDLRYKGQVIGRK